MFSWFKSKNETEYKMPELKEVRFGAWCYTPKENITPHEVSLLLPLFLSPYMGVDYQAYIDKNNLRKHFIKIEKEN